MVFNKNKLITENKSNKSKLSNKPYIFVIQKFKNNENNYIKNTIRNNNKKEFSPLSGSELDYDPDKWNKNGKIRRSHNCYSYAMGKIIKSLKSKPQPGYASGFGNIENSDYNCSKFRERLKKDSPGTYLEKFDNVCLPGFYKVFLALDPGNDYHWWRQDSSGYWSHKPGSTNVINIDGNKQKIKNPLLSKRDFGHRNYHQPCFFACVYSDLTRSLDVIYRKY